MELYKTPIHYGKYLEVGLYNNSFPIYIGPKPTKDWIAMTTDDGKGICINKEVFNSLKESPKFKLYLETICDRGISSGTVHEHNCELSGIDKEIVNYLKENKIL